ncbi:HlyD family type I secretion periplasmic adaptor subunit [uncultured Endozoicomonas sp.]|uniref:HlyD family type I secretion periplasmic adaptor subunit n=1 Tax=uncultured Endozoicomonas sp. TaxID=432652 RepID=UPI0026212DE8|nr:HlyD family type I secretion periplasmic adaptor subunit [uncultured Endozoicomonas sp.]
MINILALFKRRASEEASDDSLNDILAPSRRIVLLISSCFMILIIWASLAEIDEITRAPATVVASSRIQLIQSQDGGILEGIMVQEGDQVDAGEILVLIDKTRAEAAYLETRAKVASLSAQVSRLTAELLNEPPTYEEVLVDYNEFKIRQDALLKIRQSALREELESLDEIRDLAQQELDMNLPLYRSGDVSKSDLLRIERQMSDLRAKIVKRKNDYLQEVQSELASVSEQLETNQQLLTQRRSLLEQTQLKAPVKGVVKNVRITTVGGVVKPGEDIMQIVPLDDDLLVEAKVSPSDIAFMRLGLPAVVKVDAYDYTIFGDLAGEVVFISADTIKKELQQGETPYYRARVKASGDQLASNSGVILDIQPGMTATVEIQTGKKTVLQYITKPIIKTLDESLGER